MISEPELYDQAFPYRTSDRGYYYVVYPEGYVSLLMSRATARSYARIFGGEVRRHSRAPRAWPIRLAKWLLALPCRIDWHRWRTVECEEAARGWGVWCGECSRCGKRTSDSGRGL